MNSPLSDPVYIAAKAAGAALIALAGVNALGIEDRLSATFVAVVCTSPTVFTGVRRGLGQLVGSLVGGGITLLLMTWAPPALTLVAALFVTIWVSFLLRIGSEYMVAAFTVLYVLLIPGEAKHTLEHRLASVALGVLSAMAVNLVVSFLRRRRVFERRLAIARELLAHELLRTADVIVDGSGALPPLAPLFERPFRILRVLAEELADGSRELGASTRWRAQVVGASRATGQLLAVAHYGKDLLFTYEANPQPMPRSAQALRDLAAALQEERSLSLPDLGDEAGARSLPSAAAAWSRALEGLATFRNPGGSPQPRDGGGKVTG